MTTKPSKLIFALILLLLCMILSLSGGYSELRIIGRTSLEVEEMYGPFDRHGHISEDGLYRNARCSYFLRETSWLGVKKKYFFMIRFDENGVAVECENNYVYPLIYDI